MSLSVIPLTILGQITGVSGSGDTVLYQVSFKSIDGTPLYGVTAVWTDEQAEIEALAAQKPYGVWINPIDGTFTVKFAGYTYVGSADLTDSDVLAGITPIEFANQSGGGSGLPEVTDADNGKMLQVDDGEWKVKQYPYNANYLFNNNVMSSDLNASPPIINIIDLPEDADLTNMSTWKVYVNDELLPWIAEEGGFLATDHEGYYRVYVGMNPEDPTTYKKAILEVGNIVGDEERAIVDTFHLIIKLPDTVDENFAAAVEMVLEESGGGSGLPDVTEDDEGKQLTVVNGEWSKNGYIYVTIDRRDTSVSPNKTYVVHFHRQGKLVRVNCNAIPMSLFTDIVIPQGYRPADEYDGVRQLILNVDDNSVGWAQFDESTKKFNYFGSSTGKFLIDFTYFTYNAFPTE